MNNRTPFLVRSQVLPASHGVNVDLGEAYILRIVVENTDPVQTGFAELTGGLAGHTPTGATLKVTSGVQSIGPGQQIPLIADSIWNTFWGTNQMLNGDISVWAGFDQQNLAQIFNHPFSFIINEIVAGDVSIVPGTFIFSGVGITN